MKKIDEISDVNLLDSVKNIIGPCPYKDAGIAAFLRKQVAISGTPVEAFSVLYRSARDKKTGDMEATNELIAAICRTYVIWSCEAIINNANDIISSENRQLKKLDEKNEKHAAGIKTIKENIEKQNADIEYANAVIEAVSNPDFDIIDNLIEAYNDENNENHNIAVSIVDASLKAMYPNEDMTKYEAGCVENNVKQFAGAVCNLFRGPLEKSVNYSFDNLVELIKVEKPVEEEKPQEEEPKK